jgi:hypothetical protein
VRAARAPALTALFGLTWQGPTGKWGDLRRYPVRWVRPLILVEISVFTRVVDTLTEDMIDEVLATALRIKVRPQYAASRVAT